MAHRIEILDGVPQIAYAGAVPWHSLGKKVPHDLTPEQMCVEAGADWEVEKRNAYCEVNGKKIMTNAGFLIRKPNGRHIKEEKILTTLKRVDTWHEYQNKEAFAFFKDFVMAGHMDMDVAGVLKEGELVWATAKIKDGFKVSNKDHIESYLLFILSHRHGTAHSVLLSNVRAVCNNTVQAALASAEAGSKVSISHRNPFDPVAVKEKLGIAHQKTLEYKEQAQFLAKTKYREDQVKEYFTTVFPANPSKKKEGSKRQTKEMHKGASTSMLLVDHQPGADLAPGTWWNLYNAVTYYTNHIMGKSDDTRVDSLWTGDSFKINQDALTLACEMAKVS